MTELWIVLQREFLERVRSKSFVLSTLLTPVLLSLFALIPVLADDGPSPVPRIAVVDASGAGIGAAVAAMVGGADAELAEVTVLTRPVREVELSLETRLAAGAGVEGVLRIPADAVETGSATYRVRSGGAARLEERLSLALSSALARARLARLGLEPAVAAELFEPARLVTTRVAGDEQEEPDEAGLFFAMMIGFALYFLILLYGAQVLHSVQEEKGNRIAEVLVSSLRASHLMLGKVLGVGLTALFQVSIWLVLGLAVFSQRAALARMLGVSPEVLGSLPAPGDPVAVAAMVGFALLGFFLYASLFAGAGAAAASTEDAQRFTLPLIAPLMAPIFVAEMIVQSPRSAVPTALGWFPLTSPIVMPMRIGAGGADAPEVAGSLLVLLLSVYALGALAGKIYRVGILSTGKRPSLRELARWARAG